MGSPSSWFSGGTCPDVYYEDEETLDNGVTVTWTTVLAGFNYTKGEDYVGTVLWFVDQGTAAFDDFTERRNTKRTWTPVGRSGADVEGTMGHADAISGTVDVTVNMSSMHPAAEDVEPDGIDDWAGEIGNGHFWLLLTVDDGEGNEESVKLGVNFHLEDPAEGFGYNCPS